MAFTEIDKPSDYFNTKLYTGNGSTQSISGIGFQPDWVWLKQRANDVSNRNHMLFDSNRGTQKALSSNTTGAEDTSAAYLTSYDSDGFTLGSSSVLNRNTTTYASWNWLASNTTASNTVGDITSTVSANTTSGFSIVSYSGNGTGGATVGHGLGSALGLIILKCRDTAGTSWQMFHKSLGATSSINLESTSASFASTAYWNDTAPTSSVFSLGTGGDFNNGSRTYVAYCFAEKKGFSKFGSYTGNGSSDGTFVYTGMRPAFLIVKRTDIANDWSILDNKRLGYNGGTYRVFANLSNAEEVSHKTDFLSNGFKLRVTENSLNASGGSYIYMCFAENPFTTSAGIPTTAR